MSEPTTITKRCILTCEHEIPRRCVFEIPRSLFESVSDAPVADTKKSSDTTEKK
jgi:hypothetical protein